MANRIELPMIQQEKSFCAPELHEKIRSFHVLVHPPLGVQTTGREIRERWDEIRGEIRAMFGICRSGYLGMERIINALPQETRLRVFDWPLLQRAWYVFQDRFCDIMDDSYAAHPVDFFSKQSERKIS